MKKLFTIFYILAYCFSGVTFAIAADQQEDTAPEVRFYYKDKEKKKAPRTSKKAQEVTPETKGKGKEAEQKPRIADVMLITQYHARYIFKTEIVQTEKDRMKGLSGRTKIGKDEAMLFHFQEPRIVSMWMKDTLIPLDMLFIAENGRIVKIHKHAVPLSITPISSEYPVIAVLEIKGGMADEYRLKEGDLVLHQLLF
jgi:uncharacterized membrane protein (UPF0127 family)